MKALLEGEIWDSNEGQWTQKKVKEMKGKERGKEKRKQRLKIET
jgi:hypothetical protein